MRILGIDCGTAITGWAILRKKKNLSYQRIKLEDYGVVRTSKEMRIEQRLKKIYKEINDIIKKYKPSEVAAETLYYFKNRKTVISVGEARGVVLLSAAEAGLEVFDYTPLQVKQGVTGYGKAEKKQVQKMVKSILKLKDIPKPDDAADAIAVGICHLTSVKRKFHDKL